MVKADAYNHGIEGVVHISKKIVDRYGVATLDEAVGLRKLGVANPISLFSLETKDVEKALSYCITPVIYNERTLNAVLKENCSSFDLKIDTGMNRFGFKGKEEIHSILKKILLNDRLPRAIHTHFYSTDSISEQLILFNSYIDDFSSELKNTKLIASASAGYDCGVFLDGVRLGLGAYRGSLKIESDILSIKEVKAHETVGYGGDYMPSNDTRIAIISGGYYDGIKRSYKGATVWLNNHKAIIVGKVCMDTTLIDIGNILAKVSDKVTIMDKSNIDSFIDCDNSCEYEVITAIKGRGKRIYSYNGQSYNKVTN